MDRHSTDGLQPPSKIGLFLGAAHHRERRAHGVRLFKPPVLTLFDSANSESATPSESLSGGTRRGKQGPKASRGTGQATWVLREAQALSQRPMDTSKQPFHKSDTRTGNRIRDPERLLYVPWPLWRQTFGRGRASSPPNPDFPSLFACLLSTNGLPRSFLFAPWRCRIVSPPS